MSQVKHFLYAFFTSYIWFIFSFFEEECYYIAQAGLEVMTLPSYASQDNIHSSAYTKV